MIHLKQLKYNTEERGVSVRFLGSRERAVEAYRSMVRLNVIAEYERFIKMEPNNEI